MGKERIKKYCVKCGQSEEDVKKGYATRCGGWGRYYKRHSYFFAILKKGEGGHWYLGERKPPKKSNPK